MNTTNVVDRALRLRAEGSVEAALGALRLMGTETRAAIGSPRLGLSEQEKASFSWRDMLDACQRGPQSAGGWIREMHDECTKRNPAFAGYGTSPVFLPVDIFDARALQTSTTTGGGSLVDTTNEGFVDLAIAQSVLGRLGVQTLSGLIGNVSVPRATAGPTTAAEIEGAQINESDSTFGQVPLTAHEISAYTEVTRQLMLQTSPASQAFINRTILRQAGATVEKLLLQGSGINGQPLGVVSQAGNTTTGGSFALSNAFTLQTNCANRLGPTAAYVTTLAVASLLAQRQKAASTSSFLIEGSADQGVMAGLRTFGTNNVPTADMIFGPWDLVLVASWGDAIGIEIDRFTKFKSGTLGLRVIFPVDIGVLDTSAFTSVTSIT